MVIGFVLIVDIHMRFYMFEAKTQVNWYETDDKKLSDLDKAVSSISFDDKDGTTFYAGTYYGGSSNPTGGIIYTCSTNGGCTRSYRTGNDVVSVAGGMGSVFWSLYYGLPFLYAGTSTSTSSVAFTSSTSENWGYAQLLFIPGSTLTTAIEGTSTTISGGG